MNKTSISFALARFVFISCVMLATIITTLVVNNVVDSVNSEYEKIETREINTLNNNYQVFIKNHLILVQEQAAAPLFIQSLMQPKNNLGKIKDFMADLTLLGHNYPQSLLDFEGNTLHATALSSIDYSKYRWIDNLLKGRSANEIKVLELEGRYYWCLAVPVLYNGLVEGIFLANIPIAAIDTQQKASEMPKGLLVELIQNSTVITTFGSDVIGSKTHIKRWLDANVSIQFTVDEVYRNEALSDLVIQLSTMIVLAIVLTTVLAYLYGYRYFVKPIVALSKSTSNLEQGVKHQALREDLRFKELSDLFKQFNHMSQKVTMREYALKQSYKKLSDANEELKHSESQLVHSEKMASIGVLAAGVAHEINNPIGFIRSNLEVLTEYLDDINKYYSEFTDGLSSEEQQEMHQSLAKKHDLEFIFEDAKPLLTSSINGVDRVVEIVKNLKTFARIDLPEKALIDINEGLDATLNMVWNELKYSCKVEVDLNPLPHIHAFPGQLNQVFMNLLINASQAIEKKGVIYVRTFVKDAEIVIEIEDTGAGIEPQHLTDIFTPFYTSKPIGEGTGLGLSISHQIVEQHDGKIDVRSQVGKGSCFSVYLPVSEKVQKKSLEGG